MRRFPAFFLGCALLGPCTSFATDAHLYVQLGHARPVTSIAFSPDGRYVATGSEDQTARLWDAATGMELRRISGHTNEVTDLSFSPDGRYLLTSSIDSTARLWDPATGKELKRFVHPKMVNSATFSPDGRFVLTGCGDNIARIWSVTTGAETVRFVGNLHNVWTVAFSSDGHFVLTGTGKIGPGTAENDDTVRMWNAATGMLVREFRGHTDAITSVAFSPDGRFVLSGSFDKTARMWDAQTGRELRQFVGVSRNDFISSVHFSHDGQMVLTDHIDGPRLWDAKTGSPLHHFTNSGVRSAALSPDDRTVIAAIWNESLVLWNVADGKELRRFASRANPIDSVAVSPDGRMLASATFKMAQLWDLEAGTEMLRIKPQLLVLLNSVAFSPNGRDLIMGGDGSPSEASVDTGKYVNSFAASYGQGAVFSPDGRFVAAAGEEPAVLWDASSRAKIRSFGEPMKGIPGMADMVLFSPDGRFLLTASPSRAATLWNVATGAEIRRFEGSPADSTAEEGSPLRSAGLTAIAFSSDGKLVLTGGVDRTARLWDAPVRHRDSPLHGPFSSDCFRRHLAGW